MSDEEPMKVYTAVEVDRNELPIIVEIDLPVAAKRRLFAFIREELQTPKHQQLGDEFVSQSSVAIAN